ncbi:MAG: Uma2 family endonuclease [Gemmataceae bacterium]|nr:Uma2 family endonuclease [Gemmataceae bacterium]
MTAVPRKKLTAAEYLAIERDAEFKSEFFNGEMFPLHGDGPLGMAGANRQHNEVSENLSIEIGGRLKGSSCRGYGPDQRVKVDRTGFYTYPDYKIVCGKPLFEQTQGIDTLINPQVIVEILSDSTEKHDRGWKYLNYQRLQSMKEYVLICPDRVRIERYVRQPDETWILTIFDDPSGEFALATVPIRVPIADIYRDVELPPDPLDQSPPSE